MNSMINRNARFLTDGQSVEAHLRALRYNVSHTQFCGLEIGSQNWK